MPKKPPRPTEKELEALANLCSNLRGEAKMDRLSSLRPDLCPNPDVRVHLGEMALYHQRDANALLSVLRHLGARGLPEPLVFPEETPSQVDVLTKDEVARTLNFSPSEWLSQAAKGFDPST